MSADAGRRVVRSSAAAMSSRVDTSTSISGAASGTSSAASSGLGGGDVQKLSNKESEAVASTV